MENFSSLSVHSGGNGHMVEIQIGLAIGLSFSPIDPKNNHPPNHQIPVVPKRLVPVIFFHFNNLPSGNLT
jgi:hypothetical protein